jgi:dihydroorotate dehydrogenase electron transfer subunit
VTAAPAQREAQHPVHDEAARVTGRVQVSEDTFELSLLSPRIARAARPGQFVNVLVPGGDFSQRAFPDEVAWSQEARLQRPVLVRRPFSIYRAYGAAAGDVPDSIDLLIKVVGEGSRRLCQVPEGATLQTLGPLGRGFELPPAGVPAALVAGGCGWASLGLLARALRRREHPTYAFIGALTEESLPLRTAPGRRPAGFLDALPESCVTSEELEALGVTVGLAADQGGRVYGGLVTALLERFLASEHGAGAHVFACGPTVMLRRVAELAAEHDAPCQLAFEKRMACGMGVCMSCVCEVKAPDGSRAHKRLCVDGPVLRADAVTWAEEMRDRER